MPSQAGGDKTVQHTSEAPLEVAASGKGHRLKNTRKLVDALVHENDKTIEQPRRKPRKKKKPAKTDGVDDDQDSDYEDGTNDSSSDEGSRSSDVEIVENAELAAILPSKTAPERVSKKRKRNQDDEVQPGAVQPPATKDSLDPENRKTAGSESRKTNPIYHFYEVVQKSDGQEGDKHYRCYHGKKKIFTITKGMNYNLKGLIAHLKATSASHYTLFELIKQRGTPATPDEIAMAQGKKPIADAASKQHLATLDEHRVTLHKAWEKQQQAQAQPFDQKVFELLLTKWIIAGDHPFAEVEKPELRAVFEYLHTRGKLHIPCRVTLAAHVMELGKDTVKATKEMIAGLQCGKVSLTLDAWTSSNFLAFLAIVMTYVSNDGKLEELLIDFKEIIGAHSGENMADMVWKTMEMYGLVGKVIAFMMDNATNNDTMMEHLDVKHKAVGVYFNARHSRLRCMPHTIHLSAQKLLEGIGAFKKKKTVKTTAYQSDVLLPLVDADALAECVDEEDDDDEQMDLTGVDASELIVYSIPKLRHIIRSVRASPQSRMSWLQTARSALERRAAEAEILATSQPTGSTSGAAQPSASNVVPQKTPAAPKALILILDVITRWSSSHQMLGRALAYQDAIDDYTAHDRNNLRQYRLSSDDWTAIKIVEQWLRKFRSATLQMSATKRPMLSSVHAIFRGLQQDLREALAALPSDCNVRLKTAILEAFRKLSSYYWKFDNESPFYLWATILDPRIMCEGLELDCTDEPGMTVQDLEAAKEELRKYLDEHYPDASSATPAAPVHHYQAK